MTPFADAYQRARSSYERARLRQSYDVRHETREDYPCQRGCWVHEYDGHEYGVVLGSYSRVIERRVCDHSTAAPGRAITQTRSPNGAIMALIIIILVAWWITARST